MRWLFFPAPESECANNEPELLVTVTTTTTITVVWLGETWNMPADSGQQRVICPATWVRKKAAFGPGDSIRSGVNQWQKSGLDLSRVYTYQPPDYIFRFYKSYAVEDIRLRPSWAFTTTYGGSNTANNGDFRDLIQWREGVITSTFANDLGLLTDNPIFPTYNNYLLDGRYFGSYFDSVDSITYQWEQGNGWPGPITT